MKALHQARFADSRLAYDQRHLAVTVQHPLPTTHQRMQFVFAPDECSQAPPRSRRLQPTAHSAGLNYPVKLEGPFDALERLLPARFDHEQPRDQAMGILGYQ